MDQDHLLSAFTYDHVASSGTMRNDLGCLYLEIEGQSCLVGSVDQGLMQNRQIDLLDRMTKKRA